MEGLRLRCEGDRLLSRDLDADALAVPVGARMGLQYRFAEQNLWFDSSQRRAEARSMEKLERRCARRSTGGLDPRPRFTACDSPLLRPTFTGSGNTFASDQDPTPTHFGAKAAQKNTKPLPDEPGLRQKESARTVREPNRVSGTAESILNTRTRVEISRARTRMSRLRDGISRTRVSKSPIRLFETPASLIRPAFECFELLPPSPYPPPPHSRTSSPARASNLRPRKSAP